MAKSVKASTNYNRPQSPKVQGLYDLMSNGAPSEEQLDRFRQQFKAMNSTSVFSGVMSNPRRCDVDEAETKVDDLIYYGYEDPNIPVWVPKALEETKEHLQEYREHTERLIANFPQINSIVQAEIAKNVAEQMGSNPCAQFGDIMGSVLQEGQDIMNEILKALEDVEGNLEAVEELQQEAINKLNAAIAAAMTQIKEETDAIANAMMNMSKMSLAQLVSRQITDPCVSAILQGLLTPEANEIAGEETDATSSA